MDYMKGSKMKWYTLPHRSETANKLSKKFEVRGIPSLVIVSEEGKLLLRMEEAMFLETQKEHLIVGKKILSDYFFISL